VTDKDQGRTALTRLRCYSFPDEVV